MRRIAVRTAAFATRRTASSDVVPEACAPVSMMAIIAPLFASRSIAFTLQATASPVVDRATESDTT